MRNLGSYCVRVGSLNVGTVTGRGRGLGGYDGNEKGWSGVCKRLDGRGTKRNSWAGCKLLRSGTNEQEWNGVGIVGPTIQRTEGRPELTPTLKHKEE